LPLKRVLDATAFFLDIPFEGELCTTPSVVAELVDTRSRCRLEAFAASGLVITSPSESSLQEFRERRLRPVTVLFSLWQTGRS